MNLGIPVPDLSLILHIGPLLFRQSFESPEEEFLHQNRSNIGTMTDEEDGVVNVDRFGRSVRDSIFMAGVVMHISIGTYHWSKFLV